MRSDPGGRWRAQLTDLVGDVVDLLQRALEHTSSAGRQAAAAQEQAQAAASRTLALRRAKGALPVLGVNATATVTFTWRTPMPAETYDVDDELPDAVLGKVTRTALTTTREKAVITYKATAVTVAGQVSAIATAMH